MMPDQGLSSEDQARLQLLRSLESRAYDFVPVTPATHKRILARNRGAMARDLRDVFGWSLPFSPGAIDQEIVDLMKAGGLVRPHPEGASSRVRVSRVRGRLFFHSAFPTDADDSVFLGPDSLRFLNFILPHLGRRRSIHRLVDIGAGAGVGGISVAAELAIDRVELADINEAALGLARVNAAHAGVIPALIQSDALGSIESGFDVAIANPPFIFDDEGPVYRHGGEMLGAQISRDWTIEGARRLAPGGTLLLYTGSAIVGGEDALRAALEKALPPLGCTLDWNELDPDIFGEELEKPAYREVERIAAIGAVIEKAPDSQ